MKKISLEEYKEYLIENYVHECDNTKEQIEKRRRLLEKHLVKNT